ncbi:MAG: transglycosylase domain-containing protein [Deltaproteobacteria bacterium]|nr:transglycosylase domain-containing protein [Deltaproteobacteria bacterium]
MKKGIFRVILVIVLFGFLGGALFLGLLYHTVSREATQRIQRGLIDKIIFSESPVYYDDEKSIIGVFFEKTHRKYIHYKDIPPYFIKALVAAEDKNFFHHPGFDIKAIARAMIANIRAGRVVQGGSTLTQQTAKNVFRRERRSFKAKLKELMQALLLERKYTKEEILEMYINQFFVTGYGCGLEIAAQYFFNKEAKDLDLVECAFIAGSVKSPNAYNPFTKKTEAQKSEAMERAKRRKDYVLGQMLALNFITKEQYREAVRKEVPFREGKVTYRLNVILDYVREQLESDYFRSILEEQGIENIATSGIKIYTSINKEIQEGALKSLRYHLPLMETRISGYPRAELQRRYEEKYMGISLRRRKAGIPFLCRISHVQREEKNPYLLVAWDKGGGIIDFEGFRDIATAWIKSVRGNWARLKGRDIKLFLRNFKVGDLVAVKLIEDPENNGARSLRLTTIPELEGGVIVIRNGMVKAMVGGYFDRFFNRAVDAKRQLGSIFKPIVYAAALQLKWNTLDPLSNGRELYKYQTTYYVPKPDHPPESDQVSLAWAGVKSENLATVWLLYHLTDRLTMEEFSKVVDSLGLSRGKRESYDAYVRRIRDIYGVLVDNNSLMEAAFEEAKREIVSDLIFEGQEAVLPHLAKMHFDINPVKLDIRDPVEFGIYRHSFKRLRRLNSEMRKDYTELKILLEARGPGQPGNLSEIMRHFFLSEKGGRIVYVENPESASNLHLQPMELAQLQEKISDSSEGSIWLDDVITVRALQLIVSRMRENYKNFLSYKRYDKEVLYKVRDFRTLVNLTYVSRMGRELGICTRLDPVLSFPLGANAISIADAALAYSTLMTGQVFSLPGETKQCSMIPIITRIEDRRGVVIWEYHPRVRKILSERVSKSISEILRLVVDRGTGKGARDVVRVNVDIGDEKVSVPLPLFGKTGTANRFTNSSFVGFVPGPDIRTGLLNIKEGYVVASYVGFDDNRPMKGKRISIYGSSGALPIWTDTVDTIVNSIPYKAKLKVADLVFSDSRIPPGWHEFLEKVPVSPRTGLPLPSGRTEEQESPAFIFADVDPGKDTWNYHRDFEPLIGVNSDELDEE